MAFIRVKHNNMENEFSAFINYERDEEWKDDNPQNSRIDTDSWVSRYKHEAEIVSGYIKDNDSKSVLEIGSGPGSLCKFIFDLGHDNLIYHMIDKKYAKVSHSNRGWPGEMFVQNLNNGVDSSDLLESYDLIICNDVLEHLPNPTKVLQDLYHLNTDKLFISVPNWRMGHQFIYRGLFDYDNFLYFMAIHNYEGVSVKGSNLITPNYPKLDSEDLLPDELVRSWNWYFLFDKVVR